MLLEVGEKRRIDAGFVILHYLVFEETKHAVDSVMDHIDTEAYHVVIVDNASCNGSGERLIEAYAGNDHVSVIINKENLGFAKGNNIGFRYIRNHFEAAFIILSNNDVYLTEKRLTEKLYAEYDQNRFAVLGPKIVLKNGSDDSNPYSWDTKIDEKKIKKNIREFRKRYLLEKFRIKYPYYKVRNLFWKISGYRRWRKQEDLSGRRMLEEKLKTEGRLWNVRLHGCFWVFSPMYIERFDGLEERTFMYMEEEILYLIMRCEGLITEYDPDIEVYHAEDVSTNALKMTDRRRQMFEYQNYIRSLKVWLLIYHEYQQKR